MMLRDDVVKVRLCACMCVCVCVCMCVYSAIFVRKIQVGKNLYHQKYVEPHRLEHGNQFYGREAFFRARYNFPGNSVSDVSNLLFVLFFMIILVMITFPRIIIIISTTFFVMLITFSFIQI